MPSHEKVKKDMKEIYETVYERLHHFIKDFSKRLPMSFFLLNFLFFFKLKVWILKKGIVLAIAS